MTVTTLRIYNNNNTRMTVFPYFSSEQLSRIITTLNQVIFHEIELSKGLSTDIIRKMVYLYTIGMEYYNIIKKPSLEKFYHDKLIGLLTRSDVLAFLDKNPININDHSNLNLFNQPNKENVYGVLIDKNNKTNINNNNNNIFSDYSTNLNNGVLSFSKWKYKIPTKEEMLKRIRDQIDSVDIKLSKVDDKITKQIVGQMSNFEERKRKKSVRKNIIRQQSLNSNKSEDSNKEENKDSLSSLNPDLLKQLAELSGVSLNGGMIPTPKAIVEMTNELPARKRRVSIGQNLMVIMNYQTIKMNIVLL